MAAEVELEKLIVRLQGDSSSYSAMLSKAQTDTKQAAQQIEGASAKVEGLAASFKSLAGVAGQGMALFGLGAWINQTQAAWKVEAAARRQLQSIMEINGRTAAGLFGDYMHWADGMQAVTVVGNEVSLMMLKQAELYGLTGAGAQRAVQNAIALSGALGGEADQYLRVTAALEEGNSAMIARMIPSLRVIDDETQRTARAQELLGNMFKFAKKEATTLGGQIKQLKNAYGDLLEQFGEIVANTIGPIKKMAVQVANVVVTVMQGLSPTVKAVAVAIAALYAALVAGNLLKATAFFGMLQTAIAATATQLKAAALALTAYAQAQGMANLASMAFKGAIVAVAAYGLYKLTEWLWTSNKAYQALQARMTATQKAGEQSISGVRQHYQDIAAQGQGMTGVNQTEFLKGQIGSGETELAGMRANLQELERELRRVQPTWRSAWQYGADNVPLVTQQIDQQRQRINETSTAVQGLQRQLQEAAEAGKKATEAAFTEVRAAIEMAGLTEEEKKRAELRRLGGVDESTLEQLRQEQEYYREIAALAADAKDAKDFTADLQTQIATLGMSTDQARLYRLEVGLAGTNNAYLAQQARNAAEVLENHRNALAHQEEMHNRARETTERFLTPLQKYQQRIQEIQEIQHLLSPETFQRALTDAATEFEQVSNQADNAAASIAQFDAALSGGPEAHRRLAEYRETIERMRRQITAPVPTQTVGTITQLQTAAAALPGLAPAVGAGLLDNLRGAAALFSPVTRPVAGMAQAAIADNRDIADQWRARFDVAVSYLARIAGRPTAEVEELSV